jgi:DegV family protein with EDD domain
MKDYVIISDSACDLTKEEIIENNIEVVPFYVSFDSQTYLKENDEVEAKDFYTKMADNPTIFPKTSTPSVNDYFAVFEKYVKQELGVICICLTSTLSGSYNTAMVAKNMIEDEYKNAKVTVIDSKVITIVQGLLVKETIRMKNDGLTYEQVIETVEAMKSSGRIFFTVANIEYLKNGGRIGKLAGAIGSALRIKPLIYYKDGEITSSGIALTRAKALSSLVDLVKGYFEKVEVNIQDYLLSIGYGISKEEGLEFKERVLNVLKEKYHDIKINFYQIGATIGVHTGPYSIGVGFIKKYDTVKQL